MRASVWMVAMAVAMVAAGCVEDAAARSDLANDVDASTSADLLIVSDDLPHDGDAGTASDAAVANDDLSVQVDLAMPDLAIVIAADLATVDLNLGPPIFFEANTGLNGGNVADVDATADGHVFAITAYRGFVSVDKAANWTPLALPRIAFTDAWTSIAANRMTSAQIVAGTSDGAVWRSIDGGATFDEVLGATPIVRPSEPIASLGFPSMKGIFALTIANHVFVADDTGWHDRTPSVNTDLGALEIRRLVVGDDENVWLATSQGDLLYDVSSTSWIAQNTTASVAITALGSGAETVWGFLDDGARTSLNFPAPTGAKNCPGASANANQQIALSTALTLVAGLNEYSSIDLKCVTSWTNGTIGTTDINLTPTTQFQDLMRPPPGDDSTQDTFYAATNQGVEAAYFDIGKLKFAASDSGLAALNVWSMDVDRLDVNHLFAATQNGLFVSSNAGASWALSTTSNAKRLPSLVSVQQVATGAAATTSTVYALTNDDRIFKTTDAGATWNPCPLAGDPVVASISVMPTKPNIIYACGSSTIAHSTTSGTSTGAWTAIALGSDDPTSCRLIYVHPLDENYVYLVDEADIVWQSTNAGTSFQIVDQTAGALDAWAFDALDKTHVIVARGNAVYSISGGVTSSLPSLPSAPAVGSMAYNATTSTLYASNGVSVYRSVSGAAFTEYDAGLPSTLTNFLWINPLATTQLVAAATGLGVWTTH